MLNIKVQKENLPTRCEICHQPDLFDPIDNNCQRCKSANLNIEKSNSTRFLDNKEKVPVMNGSKNKNNYLNYNASEITFSIVMMLGCTLIYFVPSESGNAKVWVYCIGLVIIILNCLFGGIEGRARGFRICIMLSVFTLWYFLVITITKF